MEPGGERDLLSGLRRGTLEHCVLAVLRSRERYAVEIARLLGGERRLLTSEGTLYPLLSRLRRDGLVETRWEESPAGPPRRYYGLTPSGRAAVARFEAEWAPFRDAVDEVLAGEAADPLVRAGEREGQA